MSACDNCGQPINDVDERFQWGEQIICLHCAQLIEQSQQQPDPIDELAAAVQKSDRKKARRNVQQVAGVQNPVQACANCGRLIGRLETALMFQNHVVCPQCWSNLQNTDSAAGQPAGSGDILLARIEGVTVTSRHIVDGQWGHFPIEQVLSVKTNRAFISGMVVDVYDLVRQSRRYRFSGATAARQFIAALQRAKGSIAIERDDDGWFIFWG